MNFEQQVLEVLGSREALDARISYLETSLTNAQNRMELIMSEADLIARTKLAVQQAKPLLSQASIHDCEQLANAAISSVFNLPYTVEYSIEDSRFILNKGDYKTDLAGSEGGGFLCVISFVFCLYLLIKLNKRRFLVFDEFFTQLSDEYLDNFVEFLKQVCSDLKVDLLLVSHDSRIQDSQVDHVFIMNNGKSTRVK